MKDLKTRPGRFARLRHCAMEAFKKEPLVVRWLFVYVAAWFCLIASASVASHWFPSLHGKIYRVSPLAVGTAIPAAAAVMVYSSAPKAKSRARLAVIWTAGILQAICGVIMAYSTWRLISLSPEERELISEGLRVRGLHQGAESPGPAEGHGGAGAER